MRVAFVIPSLQRPSGWRTLSVSMVRAMQAHVDPVLYLPEEHAAEARELFPGVQVIALPATQALAMSQPRQWSRLWQTYSTIRRGTFPAVDLVHSLEAYPTGLVGSWLAGRLGCPHVLTANGTYGVVWVASAVDRRAYQSVLRGSSLVCPISRGTAAQMQVHFGAALVNTRLRPVLIGNDFCHKIPAEKALNRPSWEQAKNSVPTLLSVGDIKPRKGQDVSLAAFARVKEKLPQARYWIVGSYSKNSFYWQMQTFIASRRLNDVHFLGAVSDEELERCYRQASVFVLTPRQIGLHFEGFGLVYLEAGAYGLPVVATRTGGVPDVVLEGVNGLLADPGNDAAVADALLQILSDPALASRLGRGGRQRAEALTWERTAREQVQAYREVIQGI